MPLVCLRHPERQAITACSHCSKPLCGDCVIRCGRAVFCCQECLRAARFSRREAVRKTGGGIVHVTPPRLAICAAIALGCAIAILAMVL